MKKLVISGINLVDGGALSVFHDCLDSLLESTYFEKYSIYILVGNKELFSKYAEKMIIIEYPKSKTKWIYRLYYEYLGFKKWSKKVDCDVWISLHDMTPNVKAKTQYVYCHNPSPFNQMSISEAKYGWKYYLFSKFYKYLYRINIHKNTGVIVQQEWIREAFEKMFGLNNIIVARPSIPNVETVQNLSSDEKCFVYPSYPRYYNNFQVACEASKILYNEGYEDFRLVITLDGSENSYSKELVDKYNEIPVIDFTGLLSREKLYEMYGKSECMLFMSKLETWGMPIIEFKTTGKPIIVADLPYAHETVGEYDEVSFVNPDDVDGVALEMKKILDGKKLSGHSKDSVPKQPYAKNWMELFDMIL